MDDPDAGRPGRVCSRLPIPDDASGVPAPQRRRFVEPGVTAVAVVADRRRTHEHARRTTQLGERGRDRASAVYPAVAQHPMLFAEPWPDRTARGEVYEGIEVLEPFDVDVAGSRIPPHLIGLGRPRLATDEAQDVVAIPLQ